MRRALFLLLPLCLSGCFAPQIFTPEESQNLQVYREERSRAINLLSLVYSDTERLRDATRCNEKRPYDCYWNGRITNVFSDDTLRVPHVFGFLPKELAESSEQAPIVFARTVSETFAEVFREEGFRIVPGQDAVTSSNGRIRRRFTFYLDKPEAGCTVPADPRDYERDGIGATCRISVSSSAAPAGIGPYPTANGLSAIPNWAAADLAYAWRVSDTRLESRVRISEKVEADFMKAERLIRLSALLPSGTFVYGFANKSHEPFIAEKGTVNRFVETDPGLEERLKEEHEAAHAIYPKLNGAVKRVISPR